MAVQSVRVRVWDLPTRLFHWTLVVCVVGAVVSAKIGGNAMVWHFRLGYAVFALLAFRLLWPDWSAWTWWERGVRLAVMVGAGGALYAGLLYLQGIRPRDLRGH